MKKQKRNFPKEMMIFILLGFLIGCGVSSNSSSTDNGAGEVASAAIQSMSPGELARIQNQKIMEANAQTPQNVNGESENEEDILPALYNGLSSSDPAVRKRSEQTLKNLINYDDQFLEELKKLEKENKIPKSWYTASLILKDAEKAKAQAEAEEEERQRSIKDDSSDSGQ